MAYIHSMKSIKRIVLLKGGKSVYIKTFGLFGRGVARNIPLDNLNCDISRQTHKTYIPLSRRDGRIFAHYLVDKDGIFYEPELFDMTAGMQRNINF